MKIVEVIPSLSKRAGAEVLVIQLAEVLSRTNEVSVLCLYDGIDKDIENFLDRNGIDVYFLGKKKGLDFSCARRYRKKIKQIGPDVVHLHLNCFMTHFLGFGSKKNSFNVFMTMHTLIEKDFRRMEIGLMKTCQRRGALHLVGISDLITEDLERFFSKERIHTIYNGAKLFHPDEKEPPLPPFTILNVAAFRAEKNQMLLLKAFERLGGGRDLRLVFVGDGPERETVERYAFEKDMLGVEFLGQLSDVEPQLHRAHLFCLPSIYEGNPISVIEALSVGLPIIAPRVGGIPDVVEEGVNGLLFDPNDLEQLTDRLRVLIGTDEMRRDMRANNLFVSRRYSIERCASMYENLFRNAT